MNTLRSTELRAVSDAELQANLERMLNQRRAKEDDRARRYTDRQPEPVSFCDETEDSDPPLKWMLMWTAMAIPTWIVFGWCVVTVVRWLA